MTDRFTFFESYYRAALKLPEDEQLAFFKGICSLVFDGVFPEYEPGSKSDMAYTVILPHIEKSIEMYENGKKGGRPKKDSKV